MISRVQHCAEEFHQRKIAFKYDCINIDAFEISIKELPKRNSNHPESFARKGKKAVTLDVIEPEAVKQFKKVNHRMLTKYQFDVTLHKEFHSSNTIERYFKEIRRRTKAMGIFEKVKSADKLLFLIIEYLNQRRGSIPSNNNLVFTH